MSSKGPPEMDVMQLKTLQDWVVERRLRMVPGVSDVLVLGGKTKEFQAEIDLNRMRAFGVSIPQIINAIAILELTVRTVPRTLTANQVRRGGKQGTDGPELSRHGTNGGKPQHMAPSSSESRCAGN